MKSYLLKSPLRLSQAHLLIYDKSILPDGLKETTKFLSASVQSDSISLWETTAAVYCGGEKRLILFLGWTAQRRPTDRGFVWPVLHRINVFSNWRMNAIIVSGVLHVLDNEVSFGILSIAVWPDGE